MNVERDLLAEAPQRLPEALARDAAADGIEVRNEAVHPLTGRGELGRRQELVHASIQPFKLAVTA